MLVLAVQLTAACSIVLPPIAAHKSLSGMLCKRQDRPIWQLPWGLPGKAAWHCRERQEGPVIYRPGGLFCFSALALLQLGIRHVFRALLCLPGIRKSPLAGGLLILFGRCSSQLVQLAKLLHDEILRGLGRAQCSAKTLSNSYTCHKQIHIMCDRCE